MSVRGKIVAVGVMIVASMLAGRVAGAADALPPVTGKVILTIQGKIENTNRDGATDFDRGGLQAIGWHSVKTYTAWTEGEQEFEGVYLSNLLDAVKAHGETLKAEALNDYAVDIPVSDAHQHDVFLALDHDGAPMSVRDKGPIWIIYPTRDSGADVPGEHNDRMVWQLRRLIVE